MGCMQRYRLNDGCVIPTIVQVSGIGVGVLLKCKLGTCELPQEW